MGCMVAQPSAVPLAWGMLESFADEEHGKVVSGAGQAEEPEAHAQTLEGDQGQDVEADLEEKVGFPMDRAYLTHKGHGQERYHR